MADADHFNPDYDRTSWMMNNLELPTEGDLIRFDPLCNPPRVDVRGFVGLQGTVIKVWNGAIQVTLDATKTKVYSISKGQIMEFIRRKDDVPIVPTNFVG